MASKSLRSILRAHLGVTFLFTWFIVIPPAHAQCTGLCGDPNGTGTVTGADWVLLSHYVLRADWITGDMACADVDGFAGLTMRDYIILGHNLSFADPLVCTHDSAYTPIPNSEYFLHYNSIVPPGDSVVILRLEVTLPRPTRAVSMPFRALIDGQPVRYGNIDVNDAWAAGWTDISFASEQPIYHPPGGLMAVYLISYSCCVAVAPGRHNLGTVEIISDPSPVYRTIVLELVDNPPGDNTPMAAERVGINTYGWELNPAPWIIEVTGDGNNDGVLSAADIVVLVNYVFKGGSPPYPVPAAGDTNCDGAVSSADLIRLINRIFQSGLPLCDVASECSVTAGESWSCPNEPPVR